jgi:hypothetical protein
MNLYTLFMSPSNRLQLVLEMISKPYLPLWCAGRDGGKGTSYAENYDAKAQSELESTRHQPSLSSNWICSVVLFLCIFVHQAF